MHLFGRLPVVAILSVILPAATSFASDVEQHLRDAYQNKTLVLRGFYSGKHLRYDSSGAPTGNEKSGDWTTDAFVRVDNINFSHRRLAIKLDRVALADDYRNGFQFQSKRPPHADIQIDLAGDNPSPEQVDAAMARTFLTSQDDLAELVPDYWKQCVSDAETGKGTNCHFSPELLAIPGLTRVAANSTPDQTSNDKPLSCIGRSAIVRGKESARKARSPY